MPASSAQLSLLDDFPTDPFENDVQAQARQLIVDLRDAARDGRMLADRYADLLKKTVEEYCVEFEQRAEAILARLEQAQ